MKLQVYIGNNVDLFLAGRTLAGLFVQPDIQVKLHRVSWLTNALSLGLEFEGIKLGIGLSDHSDLWDATLLEWSDVYAKRNINTQHLNPLSYKVIPFGLNWACHSRTSAIALLTAVAATLPGASKGRLREVYRFLVTPHWRAFEHPPDQPVDSTILFQTRVWEPAEAPGDEIVNDERIHLLCELRRAFGARVVGGVVPTPFARQHYPNLITPLPCRQPQFIRRAKKPLIGIYFRGLFGSVAFKMAEYLAASKCIVSEPISNQLDEPISHLKTYKSTDECLSACDFFLSNPREAQEARRASWDYYRRDVSPQAHIARLLCRAREHAQTTSQSFGASAGTASGLAHVHL
jgi:hypothetical protein